jgi:hypothetical protein
MLGILKRLAGLQEVNAYRSAEFLRSNMSSIEWTVRLLVCFQLLEPPRNGLESFTMPRSAAATLQACAMQPPGACGSSASKDLAAAASCAQMIGTAIEQLPRSDASRLDLLMASMQ